MKRWLPWILLGILAALALRQNKSRASGNVPSIPVAPTRVGGVSGGYAGPAPSPTPPAPVRSFATMFNMSVAQNKGPLGSKP